jgi:hypothetical protein
MFSISYKFKMLHTLCVIFIGLFFIYLISVFYMSLYFHGKLSKIFLPNLLRIRYALCFTFFRFSIIPCLSAGIHVFLYEYGFCQLVVLTFIQIIVFLVSITIQLNFAMFKSQMVLMFDLTNNLCMILYNICLLLKHHIFQNDDAIMNVIEQLLLTICWIIISMGILTIVYSVF